MLYISTGDAGEPEPARPVQHGAGHLRPALVHPADRRGPQGEPGGVSPENYAIPKDNPFVGMKGARPEVWAYGFRNPVADGLRSPDRRAVRRRRRLGAVGVGPSRREGRQLRLVGDGGAAADQAGARSGRRRSIPALIELPHTIACSVTGGRVYRGKKFPELRGAYVFGDWETRRLWAARFEGDRTKEMPEIARPSVRIVAFGEDKDGELYFLDYDGGTLHTIERNDGGARNADFPTKLSADRLVRLGQGPDAGGRGDPVRGEQPAMAGRRDGGALGRLPGRRRPPPSTPTGKPIPGMVDWHNFRMHFPKDAVLVRTISLGTAGGWRRNCCTSTASTGTPTRSPGATIRPTPTWFPPTAPRRRCDDGKQNARLAVPQPQPVHVVPQQLVGIRPGVPARAVEPSGARRPQPARRPHRRRDSSAGPGTTASRCRRSTPPRPRGNGKLADPTDASQPLEARARAYLHANCGHCHSDGGGGSVDLRLQFPVAVAEMKAVGVRPTRGDFGLPDACIIKPGDPCASTLYFRMAKFGRDRMPHIGSERPDEAGLKLIEQWIAGMNGGGQAGAILANGPPDKLLANPEVGAAGCRGSSARGELKPAERDALLAAAAKLPAGPVRDLFEGYLPSDEQGRRKLGSNPRPRTILALKGDAGPRREAVLVAGGQVRQLPQDRRPRHAGRAGPVDHRQAAFARRSAGEHPGAVAPDRAEVRRLCRPRRPTAGRLPVCWSSATRRQVVLRDAQNKEIILAAKDVEELRPSRTSLMPDGQLAGLTAQEAADLLEYLATRK